MAIQKTKRLVSATGSRARGVVRGRGRKEYNLRKIAVSFDDDTFSVIDLLAVQQEVSFAEAVRRIVGAAINSDEVVALLTARKEAA